MSHMYDALRRATINQERLAFQNEDQNSLDLQIVVWTILKRKGLFLKTFFALFLVCCAIILILPRKYEAEMKFLVKNERQDLIVSPDKTTRTINSAPVGETEINSEIELLRSDDVLRNVVIKSGLSRPATTTSLAAGSVSLDKALDKLRDSLSVLLVNKTDPERGGVILHKIALETSLSRPEPATVQADGQIAAISLDKALSNLRDALSISGIKKSAIIDVTYPSKDPQLSSSVLKNLANEYLEAHLKSHGTPGSYAFFEQQANAYRERLKASEDQLKAFQEKNSSLVQPDQDEALTQHSMETRAALEQVDAQIADCQNQISRNQRILSTLDPRIVTQLRTVPQAQLIGNLNQTLMELRNKRTELVTKFRPDDRMVLEVDKQIADTTAGLQDALTQISTEKETDENPLHQDAEKALNASLVTLSGLQARRAALADIVDDYNKKMLSLASATIEHGQLVRQVKEDEDNYLLYRKKSEEARIAESLDQERITNVAIVQSPVIPARPKGRLLYGLLAGIFATLFASAFVLFRERSSPQPPVSEEPLALPDGDGWADNYPAH